MEYLKSFERRKVHKSFVAYDGKEKEQTVKKLRMTAPNPWGVWPESFLEETPSVVRSRVNNVQDAKRGS